MRAVGSFLASLVSLAIAGALDRFVDHQQRIRSQELVPGHGLWRALGVEVVFVVCLLVVFWLIAVRFKPPRWFSAGLFFVSSLGAAALPLHLSGIDILGPLLDGRSNQLRPVIFQYRPGSLFALQCIGLAVAAAVAFINPKELREQQPGDANSA